MVSGFEGVIRCFGSKGLGLQVAINAVILGYEVYFVILVYEIPDRKHSTVEDVNSRL